MRTRSPGLKCGSIRFSLHVSGGRERLNPVIDVLTRQQALLNDQGLNGRDPALVVAHGFIVLGRKALDGAPQLIDTHDALITRQEPQHRIGPFLPPGVSMLSSLNRSGIGPAAPIMHVAHLFPPCSAPWLPALVADHS